MMQECSMGHQQIIYVGNTSCPLCDALSDLDKQYNELMNEVREYVPEVLL
jgi:hypothetical protein